MDFSRFNNNLMSRANKSGRPLKLFLFFCSHIFEFQARILIFVGVSHKWVMNDESKAEKSATLSRSQESPPSFLERHGGDRALPGKLRGCKLVCSFMMIQLIDS